MDLITIIAFFAIAFTGALCIMPLVIRFSHRMGLLEEKNERKTHTEEVGNLGGIGIFLSFAIPMLFLLKQDPDGPAVAFALGLPLLVVSIIDDVFKVGVTTRFVAQALLGIMLYELGFPLLNLEDYWLINLGATVFFVMLLINAYNFIDGINGLAGGLGLIGSIVCGTLLAGRGEMEFAFLCFAYAGSLMGFLSFNFGKRARIFMGDNGSTVLGFFMSLMVLAVLKVDYSAGTTSSLPVLSAIVIIPVIDVFKVAAFRMFRLQSPFSPDRTHIHHLLTDGLMTHPAACMILYGWTLVVIILAMTGVFTLTVKLGILIAAGPYLLALGIRAAKRITGPPSSLPKQELPVIPSLQAS